MYQGNMRYLKGYDSRFNVFLSQIIGGRPVDFRAIR